VPGGSRKWLNTGGTSSELNRATAVASSRRVTAAGRSGPAFCQHWAKSGISTFEVLALASHRHLPTMSREWRSAP
jgi:hypothetical protein